MNTFKISAFAAVVIGLSACSSADSASTETAEVSKLTVTKENFTHAETARNFRNWGSKGATHEFFIMQGLPPRGKAAPTVQMNDDTLYGVAIVKAVNGEVTFSVPQTNNYMAVQVVTERGHGQHYVVEDGHYQLPVESEYAFILYRSGTGNGIDASRQALEKVNTADFNFATDYQVQPYDYAEVEAWVSKYTQEVNQMDRFTYTFPRTSDLVTDQHQWNLENAAGWGGASPEAYVGNKYSNSPQLQADTCYSSTFENPQNKFFTSITAYDSDKYLMEGVSNVNSHTWVENQDGSITVSFNCGESAKNNIDTKGANFTFTTRHYGVNPKVMEAAEDPIIAALNAN
ncbi:DUF1214 domain-containing protein [Agarivorans sp. B2Z047]|uniref:DUF1214 domain-containing protein n=1 Tax=Agarivorans sp. B2Z047 TaxID=2652721 RepID=UPI00128E6E8B|nr:DUF1214 domain-containing protein [Agarivorans sp. B2Z047]MPW30306.1 DUF1214 domain-containing protein [Agarivorans sp. B2Z047]UQN43064.1 DUF1214 domain-containing protein [Agarivorans sp. B2Z047]